MNKSCPAVAALIGFSATLHAATYYVATNGNDSNAGTSNAPFATALHAVTLSGLAAGDTIYVRAGNYNVTAEIKPTKSGAAGNLCKLWAFPGEEPVFDFTGAPSGSRGLYISKDYWHVRGIIIANARDNGVILTGNHNIIEGCVMHDCLDDGLTIGSTTARGNDNLLLNCDSYRNYAGGDGNQGDGYSAKAGCGTNNVFRGCRAWNNADDGWDFYDNITNSVVLQGCWSFSNGFDLWNYGAGWAGNGNGFKLGGAGTQAKHFLTNCVTFGNRRKGFDHNGSSAGQTMVNCTGYNNGTTNFSFYTTPTAGSPLPNLLINNVAYGNTAASLDPTTVQMSNSWQIASVTAADFASLDTSVATNARNADYSLPTTSLLRLAGGSDLIDGGANVGLPFNGSAPDLGAFEFGASGATRVIQVSPGGWSNGTFRINVSGLTAHGPVVLHGSSNLTTWTPIFTNPAVIGATQLLDPSAASQVVRFYRVEEQ